MRYPDTQMRARRMDAETAHVIARMIERDYLVQARVVGFSLYAPTKRISVHTDDGSEHLGYWTNIPSDLGL